MTTVEITSEEAENAANGRSAVTVKLDDALKIVVVLGAALYAVGYFIRAIKA